MSVTIMSRVFWTNIPTLSYKDKSNKIVKVHESKCKLVLLAIADSGNDYGENSWQSFATLAIKSSLTRRTTIRAIRALITNKYIKLAGISRFGTNDYSINLEKLGNQPARGGAAYASDDSAGPSDDSAGPSDDTSPESSITIQNHPLASEKTKNKKQVSQPLPFPPIAPTPSIQTPDYITTFEDFDETKESIEEFLYRKQAERQNNNGGKPVNIHAYKGRLSNIINEGMINQGNKPPEIENFIIEKVPIHLQDLARAFCYGIGRPPLKAEIPRWIKEWDAQNSMRLQGVDIEVAMKYMDKEQLTIKSPASVTAIAERFARESRVEAEEKSSDPYKGATQVWTKEGRAR